MQLKTMFEHRVKEQQAENKQKLRIVGMLEEALRGVPGTERFTLENVFKSTKDIYITVATHPEHGTDPSEMMDGVLRALGQIEGWTMREWERQFDAASYNDSDDIDTKIRATLRTAQERVPVTRVVLSFTKLGKPPACEVTITPIEERTQSIRYRKTVICTDPLTGEETRVEAA
jgi:hypothetical protein